MVIIMISKTCKLEVKINCINSPLLPASVHQQTYLHGNRGKAGIEIKAAQALIAHQVTYKFSM